MAHTNFWDRHRALAVFMVISSLILMAIGVAGVLIGAYHMSKHEKEVPWLMLVSWIPVFIGMIELLIVTTFASTASWYRKKEGFGDQDEEEEDE